MSYERAQYKMEARHQFNQAYKKAQREELTARLTGRNTQLLPFEEIRKELRQQSPRYKGIIEVPLAQIVGSVGRYKDLSRHFLPLNSSMQERWVNVSSLGMDEGWLPIELYKVGNAYFVKDGNHRVSAAIQLDMPTIEAHVWEYSDDVIIEPEESLDDILIRLGEHSFLEHTQLDQHFPDYEIRFTTPGRYSELLAQINDLRGKLAAIDGEELPYPEAVDAWYEMIYLPTIQIIHESSLLTDFPGRTEADLFVWMSLMREPLQEMYGDFDSLAEMAQLMSDNFKESKVNKISRQVQRLLGHDALPPLETL